MRIEKLSIFDKFWLSILGTDLEIAKSAREDLPLLRTNAYLLFATWILFFALQAFAITVIFDNRYAGLLVGLLSASILILVDRSIVASDWFAEGKIEYLDHNYKASDDYLASLRAARRRALSVRMLVGVVISVVVTTVASWGLFPTEFQHIADLENQAAEENTPIETGIDSCISLVNEHVSNLKKDVDTFCGAARNTASADMESLLPAGYAAATQAIAQLDSEIADARCRHKDAIDGLGAERTNSDFKPKCSSIQRVDKRGGEGAQYNAWKDLKKDSLELIDLLTSQRATHIAELARYDIGEVRQTARNRCVEARGAFEHAQLSQPSNVANCTSVRRTDAYTAQQSFGLLNTMNYYELMMQAALPGASIKLWCIKLFYVLLEISVFISRLFSPAASYSRKLYEARIS